MSDTKSPACNGGYLLLEAVTSVAVIAIGLSIILHSFASSLRASKVSQEYLIAASLLNDSMCELEEKIQLKIEGLDESDEKKEEREISGVVYLFDMHIEESEEFDSLALIKGVISWESGRRKGKIEADTFLKYKTSAAPKAP